MSEDPRRKATLTLLDPSPTEGSSDVPMLRRHGSEAAIAEDQDWTLHESDDDEHLALRAFPVLPRCALVADQALVARASVAIRTILEQTVTRGMQEVGDYLLREFYDDDPALYRSSNHAKHASIRLLERHCQTMALPVRRTFLVNALRIAVLSRELPQQASFRKLPPSHRVELLKLREPEKVEQLAAKALEGNLSVKKLRDAINKDLARRRSGRGRRPTPRPLSALRSCVAQLRDPDTGRLALRKDEIAEMSDDELAEAVTLVDILLRRSEEFARLLA